MGVQTTYNLIQFGPIYKRPVNASTLHKLYLCELLISVKPYLLCHSITSCDSLHACDSVDLGLL